MTGRSGVVPPVGLRICIMTSVNKTIIIYDIKVLRRRGRFRHRWQNQNLLQNSHIPMLFGGKGFSAVFKYFI